MHFNKIIGKWSNLKTAEQNWEIGAIVTYSAGTGQNSLRYFQRSPAPSSAHAAAAYNVAALWQQFHPYLYQINIYSRRPSDI